MTTITELDTCPRSAGCAALVHKRAIARRGKQFLEQARRDPWRANVVLQLAESVGDHVDSLSSYIDMLLALAALLLHRDDRTLDGDETAGPRGGSPATYLSWFNELGALDRSALADRGPAGRASRLSPGGAPANPSCRNERV